MYADINNDLGLLLSLLYVILSDYWGRKPVLCLCLLGLILGKFWVIIVCELVIHLTAFIFFSFIYRHTVKLHPSADGLVIITINSTPKGGWVWCSLLRTGRLDRGNCLPLVKTSVLLISDEATSK
jgi:MFS family permease